MAGVEYTIRRKVLTLFSPKFHIFNERGEVIGFCRQKAFKLKEDIRIYTDETMSEERLLIAARAIIDFSAAYDVTDSRSQKRLGALRRRGLESLFRDAWSVLDENEAEIGTVQEDSVLMATLRRFFANLFPQKYHLTDGSGRQLAEFRTHFNPFIHRMTVRVDSDSPINPMLVLATGILLVAIEGRQE